MKKLISILIVILVLLIAAPVFGSGVPNLGDIRVGLVSIYGNLGAITFGNRVILVGFEQNGQFAESFRVDSEIGLVAVADSSYYVAVGSYADYNGANARAAALRATGLRAAPAATGIAQWTVYIGGFDNRAEATTAAAAHSGTLITPNARRIALMEDNRLLAVFDAPGAFPQFRVLDGNISLGQRSYRGRIEIIRISGQNLTAVNILSVEEYLYSVVPSEMPPSWHTEALKAQAIASRSFTAVRRGVHSDSGFDICDGSHCHTYLGAGAETVRTTAAVRDTTGLLLWHQNNVIAAVYFASSGGHTDNSENVWLEIAPYLRAVADIHESPAQSWSRVVTLADLDQALTAAGATIGAATHMHIGHSANNRVQQLIISGTAGTKTLQREEIRTFFQPLPGGLLESRNFTIAGGTGSPGILSNIVITDGPTTTLPTPLTALFAVDHGGTVLPAAAGPMITAISAHDIATLAAEAQADAPPGSFVLTGAGRGHGVGMSQTGANAMAQAGFTHEQILRFYYQGIEIRR